jgi:cytochrome c
MNAPSLIGLQNHGNGDDVFFRDIQIRELPADTTPPTVSATLDPAQPTGTNGWWTGPVSVTLTAEDDSDGQVSVEYRLDGGAWTAYDDAIAVTGDGEHTVEFRGTDASGNVSEVGSVAVPIDGSAPVVLVSGVVDGGTYGDSRTLTLDWDALDATSGVASTSATLDGAAVAAHSEVVLSELALGHHVLVVTSTDEAGNVAEETVTFTVTTSFADVDALIGRLQDDGTISVKTEATLRDRLGKAEQAAAAGSDARAVRYLEQFLDRVDRLVTDGAARDLLRRDAEFLIASLEGAERVR